MAKELDLNALRLTDEERNSACSPCEFSCPLISDAQLTKALTGLLTQLEDAKEPLLNSIGPLYTAGFWGGVGAVTDWITRSLYTP